VQGGAGATPLVSSRIRSQTRPPALQRRLLLLIESLYAVRWDSTQPNTSASRSFTAWGALEPST
jgi:hypothetical protein